MGHADEVDIGGEHLATDPARAGDLTPGNPDPQPVGPEPDKDRADTRCRSAPPKHSGGPTAARASRYAQSPKPGHTWNISNASNAWNTSR